MSEPKINVGSSYQQNPAEKFSSTGKINLEIDSTQSYDIGDIRAKRKSDGLQIKGRMIIFNQSFKNSSHMCRDGSEQDIKSLTHAFERFGIVATVKSDLQLNSIVKEIHTLSQEDFSAQKLFVCVYMSYGDEKGNVLAADRQFNVRDTIIHSLVRNKSLHGIPKIFITAACRGDSNYTYDTKTDENTSSTSSDIDCSNCIISTYTCSTCYRHASNGTYFIQRLCEYIVKADDDTKIQSLFDQVNRDSIERDKNFVDFSTTMGDISFRDLASISGDVNESDDAETRNFSIAQGEINPSKFPATIKEFVGIRKQYKSKEFPRYYEFSVGTSNKLRIAIATLDRLLDGRSSRLKEVNLSMKKAPLPDVTKLSREEIVSILKNRNRSNHSELLHALDDNGIEHIESYYTKNIYVLNCDWNTLYKISRIVSELKCDLTVSGGGDGEYVMDSDEDFQLINTNQQRDNERNGTSFHRSPSASHNGRYSEKTNSMPDRSFKIK